VPLYEYRCEDCQALVSALKPLEESQRSVRCEGCGGTAHRIVSRPSVHRSNASKVDRLDAKYDRQVDRAMRNTPRADPDQHLKRMKPLDGGS
jgi:putative FmdB family regulatory protein